MGWQIDPRFHQRAGLVTPVGVMRTREGGRGMNPDPTPTIGGGEDYVSGTTEWRE
jgi:hypothetical protein